MANRNVFFYEIRPTRKKDAEWRLNVPELIAALSSLPDDQRILESEGSSGESYEFVRVIDSGTDPAIAYVRCRDHGLPMLAQQATLEPLQIAADRQLAELTHAVFFDDHVIGAEYNHYGPRLSSLASYLAAKVPQCLPSNGRIWIAPLVNNELLNLFRNAKSIKSLTLKMAPQLLDAVGAVQHIRAHDGLRQMSTGYGANRIGLDMQSRSGLSKDSVVGLVDWAFEQGAGLLSTAHAIVQLEDGTRQPINLLRTRIGAERDMELISPNARSIAHASARTEIVAAFNSLVGQIDAAATMWNETPDEA